MNSGGTRLHGRRLGAAFGGDGKRISRTKFSNDFFQGHFLGGRRGENLYLTLRGTDLEKFWESASAEGAKLRLPKARSPSRLGGLGERRKFPQRGLGRIPRSRRDFENFKPKWTTFWDPVNLTFLNNSIEKIVYERGFY